MLITQDYQCMECEDCMLGINLLVNLHYCSMFGCNIECNMPKCYF